jgi:hypothetical protein
VRLSPHFSLDELTRSEYAARHGLDNEPDARVVRNLERLCAEILEPLRSSIIGKPIFVTSGYRAPGINAAVGGSAHSDHLAGFAADIVAPPLSVTDLVRAVRSLAPYVPLKQCIAEFGSWVHVSCLDPVVDEWVPEFLVASRENGKTVYSRWSEV